MDSRQMVFLCQGGVIKKDFASIDDIGRGPSHIWRRSDRTLLVKLCCGGATLQESTGQTDTLFGVEAMRGT